MKCVEHLAGGQESDHFHRSWCRQEQSLKWIQWSAFVPAGTSCTEILWVSLFLKVMFSPMFVNLYVVGWLVGLSAWLHKNYWADFHKTWMENGCLPRIDSIIFWCRCGQRDGSRNFFSLSSTCFFNIVVLFSGNNARHLDETNQTYSTKACKLFLLAT